MTSLRELLRQEETRLELLKKMRKPNDSSSVMSTSLKEVSSSSHERGGSGVIRSGDTIITHHLNNGEDCVH